jgi:hypothetical protein
MENKNCTMSNKLLWKKIHEAAKEVFLYVTKLSGLLCVSDDADEGKFGFPKHLCRQIFDMIDNVMWDTFREIDLDLKSERNYKSSVQIYEECQKCIGELRDVVSLLMSELPEDEEMLKYGIMDSNKKVRESLVRAEHSSRLLVKKAYDVVVLCD